MKPDYLTLSILLLLNSNTLPADSLPANYEHAATLNKASNNAGTLSTDNPVLVDTRQPLQRDEFTQLPNFLWAAPNPQNARPATQARSAVSMADVGQAARRHLARYAPLYRLSATAQASAKVRHIQALAQGGYIVQLGQQMDGVDVLAQRMNMLLDDALQLVAVSGQLTPEIASTSQATAVNKLSASQAIATAFQDLHQEPLITKRSTTRKPQGAYQWFDALANNNRHQLRQPVRLKQVWYPSTKQLEPAYYLELNTLDDGQQHRADYAYVISARNGAVLARHNLTQHEVAPAFTYRVWADSDSLMPYDSPYGTELTPLVTPLLRPPVPVAPNLITLSCSVSKACDPWLPANATQTIGNNVMAYADLTEPNGFSANDVMGKTSAPNTFDYSYKFSLFDNPRNGDQLQAAIVQAFYTTNLMHDWLYDHGFDEAAGNGQANNYGRGGIDSDRMLVEVNDHSGFDNADMTTPADGATPTMQLYPWTHENRRLRGSINGQAFDYTAIPAEFGAARFALNSQKIVLADDGSTVTGRGATAGSSSDGCNTPMQNADALAGAVALVDRGGCSFYKKVKNLQAAGVSAVLIANGQRQTGMVITKDNSISALLDRSITFPILGISWQAGKTIKDALAQNASINATLLRKPLPSYNGALDNSIVIHEWAHFLSNRLVWLNNNQGSSMGEGWSDFLALLAMVKEQDRLLTGNEQFQAPYAVSQYAGSDSLITYQYPLGIRRYPYSTDLNKNPLTFKHIKNGERLPRGIKTAPYVSMSGDDNAEVHNSGEVWASMLWEAYAALLNDTPRLTFTEAQNRMLGYLVASLKMTPGNPTFLEARDALLAVAKVRDAADYNLFWKAFAKRGAGVNAKAPGRYSWSHAGVREDYTTP